MAASKNSRFADRSSNAARFPNFSDPDALAQTLAIFLESRLKPGERLCVGLSGGRDSVVLLHALCQLALPMELMALHVHHGLSANADAWEIFCTKLCGDWDVPLTVKHVEVPHDSGMGLEAAARRLRHAAFAECGAHWVALAHHRDDQAETVLLNLLRGAGVDGAGGMVVERPHGKQGVRLIRPLLDAPRSVLDAYAAAHGLAWIDDESNADTDFRRNYLRHEIMPRLVARFPSGAAALARAAGHFSEGAQLLAELAAQDRCALAPNGRIEIARLNTLSQARARNLLRHELELAGCTMPDARWIDEALRQLANARAEAATCVSVGRHELHVYRGELHLIKIQPLPPEQQLRWQGEETLPWAGGTLRFTVQHGAGLSQARLAEGELCIARRSGGEHLQLNARRPRRTLRNLLQEAAIPPWERERLPILWCGKEVAWIGAVGMDCRFACAPNAPGVVVEWVSV
jgi:tRNA(Ile)-lysidine synthase